MVLSRAQSAAALDHILSQVFDLPDTSPLVLSIKDDEGITDINAFMTMTATDIDRLQCTVPDGDDKGQVKPVPRWLRRLVSVFYDFVLYRQYKQNAIGDKWTSITKEEFDTFRSSSDYLKARSGHSDAVNFALLGPPSTSSTTGSTSSTTHSYLSSEDMFKRGIKRDQTLFPTLKDERFHDSWHRTFENQAHAQGVAEVIDPNYTPSSQSEINVFKLMQTFMYAVLETKVLTSKGKEIVRKYEGTKDAQAAYKE